MSSLDDLFEAGDRRDRGAGSWVGWAVTAGVASLLLGGGLVAVLVVLEFRLWYPVAPAAVFAALLLHRSVRTLPVSRAGMAAEPPVTEDQLTSDGLAAAVGRWRSRLRREPLPHEPPGDRPLRHDRLPRERLRPYLVELVDERLRQRHSCDRADEPDRARRLLGQRLWTYLAEPAAREPAPRELAAMLTTVEEL